MADTFGQEILTDDVFSDEHMTQIARVVKQLDILRLRVRHGCKENLLWLISRMLEECEQGNYPNLVLEIQMMSQI